MIQKLNKLGLSWPPKKAKNDLIVDRGVGALVPKKLKNDSNIPASKLPGYQTEIPKYRQEHIAQVNKTEKKRLKRHKFSGQGLLMFCEYKLWFLTQMANYNILLPPTFLKYCCIFDK